nr:MAG TPA: hypothetical protein [Bacteriophage sp.]
MTYVVAATSFGLFFISIISLTIIIIVQTYVCVKYKTNTCSISCSCFHSNMYGVLIIGH